jgi:hypothetical protein
MDNEKPRCGTHIELAKSKSARITRCSCGMVHMNFNHSGVSLQISHDRFLEVAEAIQEAATTLDAKDSEDGALGRTTIN